MSTADPTAPIAAIVADAADAFGVSVDAVIARDRLVQARFAAVWVARELGKSFAEIGRRMGGRDHSTIQHACRRAVGLRATDAAFRSACDRLLDAARRRSRG